MIMGHGTPYPGEEYRGHNGTPRGGDWVYHWATRNNNITNTRIQIFLKTENFFSLFAKKIRVHTQSIRIVFARPYETLRRWRVIYSHQEYPHTKPNESKCIRYGRIGPWQQLPDNHEPWHRTLNYRDLHEGEQEKCGVILERTIGQERIWSIAGGRRVRRELLARVPKPKLYWNWLN